MGARTGSFKVNAWADFILKFSGKTKYAAHRFVSSAEDVEVGMMISETVDIKVTVGNCASFGKH